MLCTEAICISFMKKTWNHQSWNSGSKSVLDPVDWHGYMWTKFEWTNEWNLNMDG